MPLHVQTYQDGMDRDTAPNKYSPASYFKMRNMRLSDFDELANGAPQSIKGNFLKLSPPLGYEDWFVIGYCVIRDYLVVWATDSMDDNPGGVDASLAADPASDGVIFYTDLSQAVPAWTPSYTNPAMNLTTAHPINKQAVGYYYDDEKIKVYWTDFFNQLRHIDILTPGISDVSELDMLTEADLVEPDVVNIVSGGIYAGKVQYAYQLYNEDGTETRYSMCTPLIHLTEKSESLTGSNIRLYEGMPYLDDDGNPQSSGKGVALRFNTIDTDFDKIRIVAIHYHELDVAPTIHIVGVYDTIDNLYVTDYGSYTRGTITFNVLRSLGPAHLVVGSLEQKNNKLLLGNIKQKYFDVDFDARAYRFAPSPQIAIGVTHSFAVTNTGDIDTVNSTNTKIRLDPTTPTAISDYYYGYAYTGLAGGDPLGVHYYLSMIYNETGLSDTSSNSSYGTLHDGSDNVTFTANPVYGDNRVVVQIADFQNFAETYLGVSSDRIITDVTAINEDTNNVMGSYWDGGSDQLYNQNACAISIFSFAADTLTLYVDKAGMFTNVQYLNAGTSSLAMTLLGSGFTIGYDYRIEHSYSTVTEADLTYTLLNGTPLEDRATVNFDLDKVAGNFFTLTNPFDAANITSIEAWVEVTFSGTTMDPWCLVWNSKLSSYAQVVKTGAWPNATFQIGGADVPDDHDCINPFNYDFQYGFLDEYATYTPVFDFTVHPVKTAGELQNSNSFKYQEDLTTLGGEGPNVKYEFVREAMNIDESTDTRYVQSDLVEIEDMTSYDSHQNPLRCAYLGSHKRDEVYRYGIVLVNTKAQESYVKWIGDIKTPTIKEDPVAALAAPRNMNAYSLGIKFTIDTSGLDSDIKYFKIVRVKREEKDRSIVSQGAIGNLFSDPDDEFLNPFVRATIKTPANETVDMTRDANIIQFISPEVNYFENLTPKADDYIKIQAVLDNRYVYLDMIEDNAPAAQDVLGINETAIANYAADIIQYCYLAVSKYCGTIVTGLDELPTHNIVDGVISGPVVHDADEENYINLLSAPLPIVNRAYSYCNPGPGICHNGPSGTSLMAVLDSDIDATPLAGSADEYLLYLVDYKRPGIAAYQYGGLTYEARLQNEYIDASELVEITAAEEDVECYRGDIYISMFEHLNTIHETVDLDDDGSPDFQDNLRVCSVLMFPVESHINCWLDHGYRYSRNYEKPYVRGLRETEGDWNADPAYPAWDEDHVINQDKDMYLYNRAYSQQNTSKIYLMRQEGWESVVHYDTLTKISNEKYVEETLDSYLQYLVDNEKLLPTIHGPITDLFLFKNYMIVWFEDAFGTLAIDDRALLPVQNNTLLELGAADNLQYFDFISTKSGTQHPMTVSKLGEGFCWYDNKRKGMGFYNGQTQDLGLAKGMSAEMDRMSDIIGNYHNIYEGGDIMITENDRYKEVILSFSRTDILTYLAHSANVVWFTGAYKPDGEHADQVVYINGVKYIAQITDIRVGLYVADNPTLVPSSFNSSDPVFALYRDMSLSLSFSSIINAFMFEVNIHPTYLIKHDNELLDIFGRFSLYKENEGYRGYFYRHYEDAEISYIVNPKMGLICVFNNYKFIMQAIDASGNNTIDETWDTARMRNDYQDSGVIALTVDDNIKRRHRRWQLADLRDAAAISPRARMRDTYVRLDLVYNHALNKYIIMHDLYVYYYITRESSMNT